MTQTTQPNIIMDPIVIEDAKKWCASYSGTNPFVSDIKKRVLNGSPLSEKQLQALIKTFTNSIKTAPTPRTATVYPDTIDPKVKLGILKFLTSYNGGFSFMLKMRKEYESAKGLTQKQWAGVIKCYESHTKNPVSVNNPSLKYFSTPIPIVVNRSCAMRIKKQLGLPYGPFTLEVIAVDIANPNKYKVRINAIGSVNVCRICGKTLTDHNSKVSGIGPVCAKTLNLSSVYKTDIQKFMRDWTTLCAKVGEFTTGIYSHNFKQGHQELSMQIRAMNKPITNTPAPVRVDAMGTPAPVMPAVMPVIWDDKNPFEIYYSPSNNDPSYKWRGIIQTQSSSTIDHQTKVVMNFYWDQFDLLKVLKEAFREGRVTCIKIINQDSKNSVVFKYKHLQVFVGNSNGAELTLYCIDGPVPTTK